MIIRLDKYLADLDIETRSGAKALIRKGRLKVNGEVVRKPELKVDTEKDEISLDGEPLAYHDFEYFLLNKPAGVLSASRDPRQKTVVDLLEDNLRGDLFPVGRLDKDTVGLLLLTNDGQLSHRLLSPAHHVAKTYLAGLDGECTPEDIRRFAEGLDIGDDKPTLPAILEIPDPSDRGSALVTITEGRFHQIKRMFAACGKEVVYLKRLSMGPLKLDPALKEGESRPLTPEELEALLQI